MIRLEKGDPDQNAARTLIVGVLVALVILFAGNWATDDRKCDAPQPDHPNCSEESEPRGTP
jgi:hypothetical protein